MIRINLLPTKFKSKTKGAKEFIALCALVLAVLVLVCGYVWTSQNATINHLDKRLADLKRQVRDLSDFEKKLKELQARKAIIAKKSQVVEDLRRDRDKMVRLLAVFAVNAPAERMWFERFQQSGNSITINGIAKSDDTIVEFMRNLEASPYIAAGSVNLRHSRKSGELRQFQLSCRFVPYSVVQKRIQPEKKVASEEAKEGKG
jgi:type IV pilus assembly protein PilN